MTPTQFFTKQMKTFYNLMIVFFKSEIQIMFAEFDVEISEEEIAKAIKC